MKHSLLFLSLMLVCLSALPAQVFDEQFDAWPVKTRIGGVLVIANGLDDVAMIKRAIGVPKKDAVIRVFVHDRTPNEKLKALDAVFDEVGRTTRYSLDKGFSEVLREALRGSDVFCWHSPPNLTPAEVAHAMANAKLLHDYLDKGGRLVLIGHLATFAGKLADNGTNPLQAGFDLLPDAILQSIGTIDHERMLQDLSDHPRTVGVSLMPDTALVLSGRLVRVFGGGSAKFTLTSGKFHQVRTQTIRSFNQENPASRALIDWTQWRRESIDRTLPQFPPAKPQAPVVENGTLLIVGGGRTPAGLMSRFITLAGGAQNAKLVYVPCSESEEVSAGQPMVSSWEAIGVKSATFIHTKDRNKANRDEEFLAALKDATGVWFGGGRQWNFSDSYYGTKAHELMKDVLKRGGVIGGSSAGASIQARYLARATPIGNSQIMAPGYERGGLGFISGVAIDQHFTQRSRQKDMTQLVKRYPQMLGIGLDEATAIEVRKSIAKVVGNGRVFFYDTAAQVKDSQVAYVALPAGSVYDLAKRKVMIDRSER
ncbi:MAG: cyanophycinase [Akkermansiaceae bacterium]